MNYTLDDIIFEIEKRKDNLFVDSKDFDKERFDYLDNFFNNYSGKRVASLGYMKPSEILLAFLLEENTNESFLELDKQVFRVKEFIDLIGVEMFENILDLSITINNDTLEKLKELDYKSDNGILNYIFIKNKLENILSADDDIGTIKIVVEDNALIKSFLKLVLLLTKIKNEDYGEFIAFIISLKKHKSFSDVVSFEGQDSYIEFFMKRMVDKKQVDRVLDSLYRYYLDMRKQQENFVKEKNKKLCSYTELIKIFENIKEKQKEARCEITCIDKILDNIFEEDLKKMCLECIYEYNLEYYEQLEEEYSYKSQNSINKYINYFNEFGIDFTNYSEDEQNLIMKDSLYNYKEKVKLLSEIFDDKTTCLSISIKTKLDIIKELNDLLKEGYISRKLLINNMDLYYNINLFNRLKLNIKCLLYLNMNLLVIIDKEFLLSDNELLMKNINILRNIGIQFGLLKDLSLLAIPNLQEKIDSFVEVGLEDMIKRNPDILNADFNLVKRVIISRYIGEEIYDEDGIKQSILDKDKFFVADSVIDNYLFDRDNKDYQNSTIIELSNFEDVGLSYVLEGVIIPKTRVTNLCISLDSIIKPSFYSREEVKVLEKYYK